MEGSEKADRREVDVRKAISIRQDEYDFRDRKKGGGQMS